MNALDSTPRSRCARLRRNKLRSALTMLGIVIGVGAVITMVAVGAGAQARVAEQIRSARLQPDHRRPGTVTSGGVRLGAGAPADPHRGRRRAPSQREIPRVEVAAPGVRGSGAGDLRRTQLVDRASWAVTPSTSSARDWAVAEGRVLDASEEIDGAAKVALIGPDRGAAALRRRRPAGPGDPRQEGARSRVVGVLDRKGQTRAGQDQDDVILMPLSTAQEPGARRQPGQGPRGRRHHHQGPARRAAWPRPRDRSASCCASGTSCSRGQDDDF